MAIDPFSMHHFLDKQTGKVHRKYSFKRKPCNSLVLDSPRVKQLAGYTLIDKDLRSCLLWLDEIDRRHDEGPTDKQQTYSHGKDRGNYVLIKGLFVALLTFYAKCFTRCEGRRVKLERSHLDARFHGIHDTNMMYRHNFAAHSGAARVERVQIVAAYSTPKKGKLYVKLYRELEQPDLVSTTPDDVSMRELLLHVQSFVHDKISTLSEVIEQEEAHEAINKTINAGRA